MSKAISPNHREAITAINEISQTDEYLYSSNHALEVAVVSGGGAGTQYAELSTTSPGTGNLSLGRYKTAAPVLTDGQMYGLQLDASGNLKVTGSLSVGGTTDNSAFTAGSSTGTPAMGFYHSTIDTVTDGRSAAVGITSKRAMLVNLQTAAGVETGVAAAPLQVSLANTASNATAVKVDGTGGSFPISGTVTATQGTAAAVTAGWPVVQGQLADTTGTFTNATQTTSVTASSLNGYETITVSITGTFGTATAVFEVSDDAGTTWYGTQGARTDSSTVESGYTTLTNTTRMWIIPVNGADSFRVRSTAVASGTVNVRISPTAGATSDSAIVSVGAALPTGTNSIGTVGSNSATGSAVPANAFYMGISDGTNLRGAVTAASDAQAVTGILAAGGMTFNGTTWDRMSGGNRFGDGGAATGAVLGASLTYNGSTFDRQRSVVNATNSTGTGITAAGILAQFDDTSPTSITENQFGNIRMSANRNLYGTIRDAAGNERGVNVNASNQLSVSVDAVSATNISTNIAQMNGVTVTMGNGASGTGVQRVTIASDSTGQVAPAANATATGATFSYQSALSSTKTAIDASAGNLYGYHIYNPNSVVIYIQCWNLASASVTVGTTAPSFVIVVPAFGWADSSYPVPITFGTALTVAATTTASGSGAPTSGLTANFWYK